MLVLLSAVNFLSSFFFLANVGVHFSEISKTPTTLNHKYICKCVKSFVSGCTLRRNAHSSGNLQLAGVTRCACPPGRVTVRVVPVSQRGEGGGRTELLPAKSSLCGPSDVRCVVARETTDRVRE